VRTLIGYLTGSSSCVNTRVIPPRTTWVVRQDLGRDERGRTHSRAAIGGMSLWADLECVTTRLKPAADDAAIASDRLAAVVAAFLGRYRGQTRLHISSDLRCFLAWCADSGLGPLSARRPHLELYPRWMQETRRFKPSTLSRRFSLVAGFYRAAVIDGVLEASPAEHVRRPMVPPESPILGLPHLQFEALRTAARESSNVHDFALVAMLGLLGLRIFEATSTIADLGEQHGHRVLRVVGKSGKVALVPLPPAVGRVIDRAVDTRDAGPILRTRDGTRMDRHAATRRLRRLAEKAGCGCPACTHTCCATPSSPPCSTRASICATCRSRPGTQTRRTTMHTCLARDVRWCTLFTSLGGSCRPGRGAPMWILG
jgi:integrase/recombinase XerD